MAGNVLSWGVALDKGYTPWLYVYAPKEVPMGEFDAILDFKIWAKKVMGISCYFTQMGTGRKFQLTVYLDLRTRLYRIQGCEVDFVQSPIGHCYQVKVSLHSKGRTVFEKAVLK